MAEALIMSATCHWQRLQTLQRAVGAICCVPLTAFEAIQVCSCALNEVNIESSGKCRLEACHASEAAHFHQADGFLCMASLSIIEMMLWLQCAPCT
jgi:hypothetical protein